MKKVFSISLSILIFLSSAGICFSKSYCPMSKRTTFSIVKEENCCCKKSDEKNCCKSKQIKLQKIKDNYSPSTVSKAPSAQFSGFVLSYLQLVLFPPTQVSCKNFFLENHSPPNGSESIVILHRAILI